MPRPKGEMMTPKAPVEFTAERKRLFLEKFRETGFQVVSAEYAGVTARTVQKHRDSDPEFADQYQDALDFNTETTIVATMRKRAIEGYDEPVVGGQFRDTVVTHVRKFSDPCLLALARSRRPEFNKGAGGEDGGPGGSGSGSGGGVFVVPAAPHTILDWTSLYGEKARGTTGRDQHG